MNYDTTSRGYELKVVIEQEVSLLESLLELMHDERELLVNFKPHSLLEHNKRKALIVTQHRQLDRHRVELSLQLAGELKMDGAEPSLRELAEALGGEMGHELLKQRSKLRALVESIHELNDLNQRLIDFSIKSVRGSVSFLKGQFFNSKTYSASGEIKQEIGQISRLNSRA